MFRQLLKEWHEINASVNSILHGDLKTGRGVGMELLDRYLQAVRKHLPWERQDDLVAELRANLESQLEDREGELARPLTEKEVAAWLKEVGPPIAVAGKYQPTQYLIGPAMFPIYWYVLRLALIWSVAVYAVVDAVLLLMKTQAGGLTVAEAVMRTPGVLLTTAAWVTLVFACLEATLHRYPGRLAGLETMMPDWSPSALPPVAAETLKRKEPRTFSRAVAEVVFGALLLVWLLLIPQNPWVLMGPGWLALQASPFAIAPVWRVFFLVDCGVECGATGLEADRPGAWGVAGDAGGAGWRGEDHRSHSVSADAAGAGSCAGVVEASGGGRG